MRGWGAMPSARRGHALLRSNPRRRHADAKPTAWHPTQHFEVDGLLRKLLPQARARVLGLEPCEFLVQLFRGVRCFPRYDDLDHDVLIAAIFGLRIADAFPAQPQSRAAR